MNLKPFRILVPIKRVIDPNIRVTVSNGAIDTANVKHSLNPFDSIAVEEALRLKAVIPGAEVIAVTVGGSKSIEVLQTALGMGVERAVHVVTDKKDLAPLTVARALAHIVKQRECELALLGKQAVDSDHGQTGSMLAALLNWPQASFARKIVFDPVKSSLNVITETDIGLRTVELCVPAVIIAELGLNTPRYVSLTNMIKAKRKPIDTMSLSDLKVEEIPPLEVESVFSPQPRLPCKFVNNISELVQKLREDKVL